MSNCTQCGEKRAICNVVTLNIYFNIKTKQFIQFIQFKCLFFLS